MVRLAKEQGVILRQSYQRKGPKVALKAGRYAHAQQFKRMRKSIKTLKTYLGRVVRDIERKTDIVNPELKNALTHAKRLLKQQRNDRNKLYSLHVPHVSCISKGKAHKKYEFGNKVSVCVTNKEGFIVGSQGLEGNPYDGHTLKGALSQVADLTGTRPERCYVDRGYRGHGVTDRQTFSETRTFDGASDWCLSPLEEVKQNLFSTGYDKGKFHFIKGKVEETIPKSIPKEITLLRLDTDWYESTKHELIHLFPLLKPNGVLIIDDYGHWEGARKAVDEYISDNNIRILLNRIDYTGRITVKT